MKRVIALAALQVVVILGWAGYHEHLWATAPTFRIPLRPRDPYDVLRGRYFALQAEDGRIKMGLAPDPVSVADVERLAGSNRFYYGPALVGFCDVDGLYRICALRAVSEGPPSDQAARFWSRARVTLRWEDTVFRAGRPVPEPGWVIETDLGLYRFFIPNGLSLPARENEPGWELEVCHRPGLSPLPRRLWFRGTPVGSY